MSSASPNVALLVLARPRPPSGFGHFLRGRPSRVRRRGEDDAATMTEIAARSHTAIGSLYRFFPTKELIAEALLAEYAGEVGATLSEIQAQLGARPRRARRRAYRSHAAFARRPRRRRCSTGRPRRRSGVAQLAQKDGAATDPRHSSAAAPSLATDRIEAVAAVLQQMMKSVVALIAEDTPNGPLIAELRKAGPARSGQLLGERFPAD